MFFLDLFGSFWLQYSYCKPALASLVSLCLVLECFWYLSGKSEAEVPLMRALSERIAACEESCRCVDTFVERFKDLAAKVQEGFADASGKVARRPMRHETLQL